MRWEWLWPAHLLEQGLGLLVWELHCFLQLPAQGPLEPPARAAHPPHCSVLWNPSVHALDAQLRGSFHKAWGPAASRSHFDSSCMMPNLLTVYALSSQAVSFRLEGERRVWDQAMACQQRACMDMNTSLTGQSGC